MTLTVACVVVVFMQVTPLRCAQIDSHGCIPLVYNHLLCLFFSCDHVFDIFTNLGSLKEYFFDRRYSYIEYHWDIPNLGIPYVISGDLPHFGKPDVRIANILFVHDV